MVISALINHRGRWFNISQPLQLSFDDFTISMHSTLTDWMLIWARSSIFHGWGHLTSLLSFECFNYLYLWKKGRFHWLFILHSLVLHLFTSIAFEQVPNGSICTVFLEEGIEPEGKDSAGNLSFPLSLWISLRWWWHYTSLQDLNTKALKVFACYILAML